MTQNPIVTHTLLSLNFLLSTNRESQQEHVAAGSYWSTVRAQIPVIIISKQTLWYLAQSLAAYLTQMFGRERLLYGDITTSML